jgi:hypothetical protein
LQDLIGGFDSVLVHMEKTISKTKIILVTFIVFVLAIVSIRVGVIRDISSYSRSQEKIANIKNRPGKCRFKLEAWWNGIPRTDVRVWGNVGTTTFNPSVGKSDSWQLVTTADCYESALVTVNQTVYGTNMASCQITVNNFIAVRKVNKSSRVFSCLF